MNQKFFFMFILVWVCFYVTFETTLINVKAEDAQIIVIDSYTNKGRTNVGVVQYIGFKLVWSTNHSEVQDAVLYIDGTPNSVYLSGWTLCQVTSDVVQKKEYKIEKIVYSGKEVSFRQECPNPVIIWDRIVIELYTKEIRVNVGSEATIYWTAYYAYDGFPFSGEIFLNNTQLNYSSVGRHVYTINWIKNDESNINSFKCNDLGIVWDKVEISLTPLSERVDVGTVPSIKWRGHYAYDGSNFLGSVTFNMSLPVSEVGKKRITVSSITDPFFHLTVFHSDVTEVIFDKINLNLSILHSRVNVGERIQITWNGRYVYDNIPFTGFVYYNDTRFKLNEPGNIGYKVSSILDKKHGLTAFSSNKVSCIWDRVNINLSVDDTRVDVGSPIHLKITGSYEYDGDYFTDTDSIKLNDYTIVLDNVGKKQYKVVALKDSRYNITAYSFNNLTVIWDIVELNISVPYQRCKVGSSPTLSISGKYTFDGTPFQGNLMFNDTLIKTTAGIYRFSISDISDTLYGLNNFRATDFSVNYDEIDMDFTYYSLIPGKNDVYIKLTYRSDGTVVDDASVTVNNQEITRSYDAVYITQINNWFPASSTKICVDRQDFVSIIQEKTMISVGNTILLGVIAISIIILFRKTAPHLKKFFNFFSLFFSSSLEPLSDQRSYYFN